MKNNFYKLAATAFIGLAGACALSGRGAVNDTVQDRTAEIGAAGRTGNVGAEDVDPAARQRAGRLFVGTIGSAKVELDIKREGDMLTGSYFYRKSGSANRLKLSGKISAGGSFTMQESDAAGKQTGALNGKWVDDPNSVGASLEGEWLKPGQTSGGQGFYAFEQMVDFKTTTITTREFKDALKPKKAEMSAEYPELAGSANAAGFNQLAKAGAMNAIAEFKKDMAELTAADVKNMPKDMSNYVEVSYNIEYADEDLISVSFDTSTFEGGAHPNHNMFALTYDLKAGREVKLADLFQPSSKYLATIANYAVKDLKGRKDPDNGENSGFAQDIFEDGAKPTAENYQNWNVTKKGLLISFPPYQVAAYAFGPQAVIVPYSELKDIAKPSGPLAKAKK